MVTRETIELRERTSEQLSTDLEEAHEALFNLRFQAATRQLADVAQVGNARRRIARIKTLLRERQIINGVDRLAETDFPGDETLSDDAASETEE